MIIEALQPAEHEELGELEAAIDRNLKAFYEVGAALMEIRDSRLYREQYATFEDYCRDRWDFVASRARQLIASVEAVENVKSVTIVTPTNEAQVRPLAKLEPEKQKEVWQKVIETAPEGKVTARHVAKVARETAKGDRQEKIKTARKKIKEAADKELMSDKFKAALDDFYGEVQNAKARNWRDTSKIAALSSAELIIDIISI